LRGIGVRVKSLWGMEEAKKLSIAQCRKILEEGGTKYSDEQIRIIRDVLCNLAELDYFILNQAQRSEISDKSAGFKTNSDKAA
jgi:hypothetical protein